MLAAIYLAAYLRLIQKGSTTQHFVLGPTSWALAAGGLVLGKVYGKRWAMIGGGVLAVAGVALLLTDPGTKDQPKPAVAQ